VLFRSNGETAMLTICWLRAPGYSKPTALSVSLPISIVIIFQWHELWIAPAIKKPARSGFTRVR